MHEETLYLKTKIALEKVQNEIILKNFYLAGGTALALQLGHSMYENCCYLAKRN